MKKLLVTLLFLLNSTYADSDIWNKLVRSNRVEYYPGIIKSLIDKNLYHTSVPYLKEYLVTSGAVKNANFDRLIDEVIEKVGDRQFVLLPEKYLSRSNSPTIKYILAKKLLRKRKLSEARTILTSNIEKDHPMRPFASHLLGMIYSIERNYVDSINEFKKCVSLSTSALSDSPSAQRQRQLIINRDYCSAGIARAYYAAKDYLNADLAFLDVEKSSLIWPELLFEEAWNSYYKGDYNRTLGKLVTYRSPVLSYVFNPEVDVLNALSFFQLCLYNDASRVIENYYRKYEKETRGLGRVVNRRRNDLNYYFNIAVSYTQGKKSDSAIVNSLLDSVLKDPAFLNLMDSYKRGKGEIDLVRRVGHTPLRKVLTTNLKDSLTLQQKLIGSYVKRTFKIAYSHLTKSFASMSYLKLEILAKKKDRLYSGVQDFGKRGDIAYLQKTQKQYFWNFNGEFWADELGDYVFALRSECN